MPTTTTINTNTYIILIIYWPFAFLKTNKAKPVLTHLVIITTIISSLFNTTTRCSFAIPLIEHCLTSLKLSLTVEGV